MSDFKTEYNKAVELYDFLRNNNNVCDQEFEKLWDKLDATISIAEIVDSILHEKDFKNMIGNVSNPDNLRVLWKKPYNNAKIGDIINGGKVIGVFTLTVWIENLEDDCHQYCCEHYGCGH
jgi:hypothetical protein